MCAHDGRHAVHAMKHDVVAHLNVDHGGPGDLPEIRQLATPFGIEGGAVELQPHVAVDVLLRDDVRVEFHEPRIREVQSLGGHRVEPRASFAAMEPRAHFAACPRETTFVAVVPPLASSRSTVSSAPRTPMRG